MTIKLKSMLSVIAGGLISLLIVGFIIGVSTYLWMLHLAYEPITDTKDFIWTYVFGLILLSLVILSYRILRNKRPQFSYGLLIGLIPIVLILYFNTTGYYDYLTPDDFNKKVWMDNNPKPFEMAHSLISNRLTEGLTKNEVIELLGTDYTKNYSNDSTFVYQLDIASFTYVEIHFDSKGVVAKTNYRYND